MNDTANHNAGTVLAQCVGYFSADASAAAGDQGHAAVQNIGFEYAHRNCLHSTDQAFVATITENSVLPPLASV